MLNVESGLNDGIATPFVFFALALATAEASGDGGWLAGATHRHGHRCRSRDRPRSGGRVPRFSLPTASGGPRQFHASSSCWLSAVACYLLAIGLGGNGFIAAFVGGLAFAFGSDLREESAVRFTETQGDLLAIGVWAAFGLTMAGELWAHLGNLAVIGLCAPEPDRHPHGAGRGRSGRRPLPATDGPVRGLVRTPRLWPRSCSSSSGSKGFIMLASTPDHWLRRSHGRSCFRSSCMGSRPDHWQRGMAAG